MSEEITKENNSGTAAEIGVSSPEQRLAFVQLKVTVNTKNPTKALSDIKAENGKKFAEIRASMAKNLLEAENESRKRTAQISTERKEEHEQILAQSAEPESFEDSKPEINESSSASAEQTADSTKNDSKDEFTIKLGGSPLDYGEKCIIRIGTPQVPSYFFTVPCAQHQNGKQTIAKGSGGAARNGKRLLSDAHAKRLNELTMLPLPYREGKSAYEDRYPDTVPVYPDSAPVYPDPAPVYPDSAPVYPDPAPVYPDPAPVYPDPAPVYPDPAPVYPDPVPVYPDPAPVYPNPAPVYPDSVSEKFSAGYDIALNEQKSMEYALEDTTAEQDNRIKYAVGEFVAFGKDNIGVYEVAQLNKTISAFYKEESASARRIQKIEARQKYADEEQNIALTVEKIAVQKELCELAVETLGACVCVSARGKASRQEKLLRTHIDRYNLYCEEYEKRAGRPLHRLDYGMIEDTMSGRISRPIPNVYYYGAEGGAVYNSSDAELDRLRRAEDEYAAIGREYERYIEDGGIIEPTPAETRAFNKRNAERISAIRRATERDLLLVALRNEYRIEDLEARRDILLNSYGSDKGRVMRELRAIERTMSKVRAASRRSISIEREDNTRFYFLSALDPVSEKVKEGARRDRLASLRQRLEVLLSERESINERLIVLYGGSDKKLRKAKVNRKAAAVRRKSARRTFKKQGDLARRIERFNVSSDMKEKAYLLLNQKTAAVAKADEIRYKITHLKPHGRARGELYSEFKRARKEIRRTDSEIRYMLRRLKKIQDRNRDRRELTVLFALIVVFAAILGVVWLGFGDGIAAYFKELIAKLRGL